MGTFPDVARPVGDAARVHPGHEGAERAARHLLAADDTHTHPVACNQSGDRQSGGVVAQPVTGKEEE